MLILKRHLDEITKGENAEAKIILVGVRGGNIILGITAPPGITVYRNKVCNRIQKKIRVEDCQKIGENI